jgi:hypothetical protein
MPARHKTAWLLAASVLLVWWYISHSRVGPNSVISLHAQLAIEPPFVFRLLVPRVLAAVLPTPWLDLAWTRGLLAWACVGLSMWLMPAYMARIMGRQADDHERWRGRVALLAVLIAHYALPRALKFYYVYDLPAVLLGMVLFLLLTDPRAWVMWLGVVLAPVFALNRETAIVAALHAGAWWWATTQGPGASAFKGLPKAVWMRVALACVGILMCRWLTSIVLAIPAASSVSWMEGDQVRLLANLQRIVTKHVHALALLWFGAGALIWLPRKWRQLSPTLKAMFIVSMPPGVLYCIVGNIVELRMFSEFVPLLAAALAWVPPGGARQGAAAQGQPGA